MPDFDRQTDASTDSYEALPATRFFVRALVVLEAVSDEALGVPEDVENVWVGGCTSSSPDDRILTTVSLECWLPRGGKNE